MKSQIRAKVMEHTGTITHFLKMPCNRSFPLIAGNLLIQNKIAESTLMFNHYQNHPREKTLQKVFAGGTFRLQFDMDQFGG